jgi:hypothetical protein
MGVNFWLTYITTQVAVTVIGSVIPKINRRYGWRLLVVQFVLLASLIAAAVLDTVEAEPAELPACAEVP